MAYAERSLRLKLPEALTVIAEREFSEDRTEAARDFARAAAERALLSTGKELASAEKHGNTITNLQFDNRRKINPECWEGAQIDKLADEGYLLLRDGRGDWHYIDHIEVEREDVDRIWPATKCGDRLMPAVRRRQAAEPTDNLKSRVWKRLLEIAQTEGLSTKHGEKAKIARRIATELNADFESVRRYVGKDYDDAIRKSRSNGIQMG